MHGFQQSSEGGRWQQEIAEDCVSSGAHTTLVVFNMLTRLYSRQYRNHSEQ